MTVDAAPVPARGTAETWNFRLALWTWFASIPLILFGGTVTTMRAGMAEDGWLQPDGHFLWFYPLAQRAQSLGFFVEHHHREFGSLVGLLAISSFAVALFTRARPAAKWLSGLALLAVCLQGLLGGLRVLENSPRLAFVHGALAQAVFALLAAVPVVLSARWAAAAPPRDARRGAGEIAGVGPSLVRSSTVLVVLAFAQAVLGAIFRHSGEGLALSLHVLLAVGVLGAVAITCRHLKSLAAERELAGLEARVLRRAVWRLHALIGVQILLGVLTTFFIYEVSGGMQAPVSVGEAVFATAHVAVGALLLASAVEAAIWARRVTAPAAESARVARPAAFAATAGMSVAAEEAP